MCMYILRYQNMLDSVKSNKPQPSPTNHLQIRPNVPLTRPDPPRNLQPPLPPQIQPPPQQIPIQHTPTGTSIALDRPVRARVQPTRVLERVGQLRLQG